jgi:ClpP class serine protease
MQTPYSLFQTLLGIWSIDPHYAIQMWNIVNDRLRGDIEQSAEPKYMLPFAMYGDESFMAAAAYSGEGSVYDSVPKGSVAIIPVMGVMTKQDQFCGPVGMATVGARLLEADAHKNIAGSVVLYESGGGQIDAIHPLTSSIKQAKKPVNGVCDSLLGSAALISSAFCNQTFATHDMCRIGSLGVMGMFENREQWYKEKGITLHSYRSTYSYNKNKNELEAIAGNGELIRNNVLDKYARNYINQHAQLRGGKLRDNAADFISKVDAGKIDEINADNVFSGEMFLANECTPSGNGLIDGIMSLADVVKLTADMAKNRVIINL